MFSARKHRLAWVAILALSPPAAAQEDATVTGPAFQEGDVITYNRLEALRPYLPEEFWANRDFFFYEGMELEIGPAYRDYTPSKEYVEATERFRGQARIGPGNSLENYTAGQPFPMDEIDCTGDPKAGAKIIWNFDYQWEGNTSRSGTGTSSATRPAREPSASRSPRPSTRAASRS
jgi:hypothetical protein